MALVNQLAANGGAASVGFANPALYAIYSTSNYDKDFHDVVSGCTPDSSGNTYCAGTGYDLTTGLGSPQHLLIYALSGVQSYPLYCQGPLTTTSGSTPFKWAATGAGAANPGPGECMMRAPRGFRRSTMTSNADLGDTRFGWVNLREIGEIWRDWCVSQRPTTNDMVATQVVGLVFGAVLVEPGASLTKEPTP